MFLILDEEKRPDIMRDERRHITYQVLDVVKEREPNVSISIIESSTSSDENSEE